MSTAVIERTKTIVAPSVTDLVAYMQYQKDLVRTGQYEPLGRAFQIAIGPVDGYTPPLGDPLIDKYGRFMHLGRQVLSIAQSVDRSTLLVLNPMCDKAGRVGLPDWPKPGFYPEPDPKTGKPGEMQYVKQALRDRTNQQLDSRRKNILVFQPIECIALQPEINGNLEGETWILEFGADPVTGTRCALLVDEATGETHLIGGRFDIHRS